MHDSGMAIHVRPQRLAAGLSQAQLAERAGVSRQAIVAIEAGRSVPSTVLALQLARALGCSVHDLFVLSGGPTVTARLAASQSADRRVVVGRVAGELVAHRLGELPLAADGVLQGAAPAEDGTIPGHAAVTLFQDASALDDHVLAAGCAPLLGVLADRMERRFRHSRASWIPANSHHALELLRQGLVHLAGVHLADAADPDANIAAARRILGNERVTLINLARWRQGLVVAAGNPLGIRCGVDLGRADVRIVQREDGAAAQVLLLRLLRDNGIDSGCVGRAVHVASGHREVAQLVKWGVADVGVAIEAVAMAEGLAFVPLSEERFDLLVPDASLALPAVEQLLDLIERPAFQAEAAGMPGYDLAMAGQASSIEPVAVGA